MGGQLGHGRQRPDKDFVHLLTRRLQQETPGAQIKFQNIAEWEHSYWKYNLARFDTIKQFNPDLLVVRLGENVNSDSVQVQHFGQHLSRLVDTLKGLRTKILIASSFWNVNQSVEAMQA